MPGFADRTYVSEELRRLIDSEDFRRLETSRARWRTVACCLGCLAVGLVLGGMVQNREPRPIGVALDTASGSGRWSATLYTVNDDGKVYMLNTVRPDARWELMKYSPGWKP